MKKRIAILSLMLVVLLPLQVMAGGQGEAEKAGTVKFWHGYPEMDAIWKDIAARDYMAANPGIKIETASFPLREFERKLAVALPTGTGPDLFYFAKPFAFKYIKAGLFNKAPKTVVDFVKKSFPKAWVDEVTYDNHIVAMPYTGGIAAALYNTDMYVEAGLSHAPTNWDEVIDFAQKTTKRDASGKVTRSGVSLRLSGGGSGIAEKFKLWMYKAGGEVAAESKELGKYHAGYDNEAGRSTLQLYIDLLYKYNCDSFEIKHGAEALALEQTAYFQREAWVIGYMKEHAPNVNFDAAPLPRKTSKDGLTFSINLNVSEKSEQKDLAWDFAMFISQEKYLKNVMRKVGWLPCRSDISYEDIFAEEPRFRPFMELPSGFVGKGYPLVSTTDEIYTKFAAKLTPAFQRADLVDNPSGIAKVISDAAKETNDILKEAGEYGE